VKRRPLDIHRSDVVVVGSGVAGLATALYADGRAVTVLTKARFSASGSSVHAQGGVAVALGGDDSPARHAADTVAVGGGLTDRRVAVRVAREGAGRVVELLRLGLRLDRDPSGRLALGREAAHSRRRVAHADGDATGAELVRALADAVAASDRVDIREHVLALDLIRHGGRVAGVLTADREGRLDAWVAPVVVVATGGIGRVYRCTTNPVEGTGDGLAMAARAGARLTDLEFVQFHPTALADGSDPMALLTEALRGDGAVLRDETGDRFMTAVHPAAELAPRDVVARGIWYHQAAGHRVVLDATHLGDRLPGRFPTVFRICRERGLDPRAEGIPVAPAAHYHMGGVKVDAAGRTSLPGLWAAGEVAATGLHGSNRLASNSLLEALVYGARVGEAMSGTPQGGWRDPPAEAVEGMAATAAERPWLADVPEQRRAADELRDLMWREVGLVRSAAGMERALAEIRRLEAAGSGGELGSLLLVARLVATAALAREESRGAHHRVDFPETSPRWRRHLVFVGERLVSRGPARVLPRSRKRPQAVSTPGRSS